MPDWITVRIPDGHRTASERAPFDPETTNALVRAARSIRRGPSRLGLVPRDSIYVILLEFEQDWRLYVGRTGLTPEERFLKHKAGTRAAGRVERRGVGLLPALYKHLNPLDRSAAEVAEVQLAEALRTTGVRVYQG